MYVRAGIQGDRARAQGVSPPRTPTGARLSGQVTIYRRCLINTHNNLKPPSQTHLFQVPSSSPRVLWEWMFSLAGNDILQYKSVCAVMHQLFYVSTFKALIRSEAVFNLFLSKPEILNEKWTFPTSCKSGGVSIQIVYLGNFQSLKVVARGSETHL